MSPSDLNGELRGVTGMASRAGLHKKKIRDSLWYARMFSTRTNPSTRSNHTVNTGSPSVMGTGAQVPENDRVEEAMLPAFTALPAHTPGPLQSFCCVRSRKSHTFN